MILSIDCETTGLFVDDGARVWAVSCAWRQDGNERGAILSDVYVYREDTREKAAGWFGSMRMLQEGEFKLVMHNAKFDLHMIKAGTQWWPGVDLSEKVVWDTMLVSGLLDPLESQGLKENVAREWSDEAYTREKLFSGTLEEKIEYSRTDAIMTLRLYERQVGRVAEGEGQPWLIERELEKMKVLFKMEERGIGFAGDECRAANERLVVERDRLIKAIPFKTTPAGARAWFFGNKEDGGLDLIPVTLTPGGKASVNEHVITKLVMKEVPGAREFRQYRTIDSAITKWYGVWPSLCGVDGRLRTNFKQSRVITGRLAVDHVQLQAIPHDYQLPEGIPSIRSFFRAGEGKQLWELDLSQAEMRVAARIANCGGMIEILEKGEDNVHDGTAKRIFGVDEGDRDWQRYRDVAKRLNFATIYGAGARTLAEQIEFYTGKVITEREARDYLGRYREEFPEFARVSSQAEKQAARRRFVRMLNGRLRWFGPMDDFHKAFNAVIQGNVAEFSSEWMIDLEKGWPGILLLQIHDSVVLEVSDEWEWHPELTQTAEQLVSEIRDWTAEKAEAYFGIKFAVGMKRW